MTVANRRHRSGRWRVVVGTLLFAVCRLSAGEELTPRRDAAVLSSTEGAVSADQILRDAFAKLDRNGDGSLSKEEHLAGPGPEAVAARDFKLFDFDRSGSLSPAEFSAIPGLVPAAARGPVPDPFQDLLEIAVASLDEAYGDWNQKPDFQIQTQGFGENFSRSLSSDGSFTVTSMMFREADPDQNGRVSRDEARRFLEIQLGIRRGSGEGDLLREPTGRVVNYALFVGIDTNRNGRLEANEFADRDGEEQKAKNQAVFDKADVDRSGFLSFSEFCERTPSGMTDPVEQFRRMDNNLDAVLDAGEVAAGTPDWQRALVPMAFPVGDRNGDGKLTLAEYQLTPQANMLLRWQGMVVDLDRDETLSFEEFQLGGQFSLLRKLVYTRLDRDDDGTLSPKEFAFEIRQPDALFVMEREGRGWKKLTQSREFPTCGSPAVSPDGRWVAFDGYGPGESYSRTRLFIASIDGNERREVCAGLMPTWSPDGKKLACSRYEGGNSVWIMNLDGSEDRKIGRGWGAQWSPDGKTIAYTRGAALMLYDVASGDEKLLLQSSEIGFSSIHYNMTWSPDSQRICFRGTKNENQEQLASIRVTGEDRDLRVHYKGPLAFEGDPGWSPDGKRIYVGLFSPEHKKYLIHELDVRLEGKSEESLAEPQLLAGQDLSVAVATHACSTPDGRRLIIRARPQ